MNNDEFRRMVLDTTAGKKPATPSAASATPGTASRSRISMLMTPRHARNATTQAEFARQLAARQAINRPAKKVKTNIPKGYKAPPKRIDDEADERARRIKALEEMMKEGEIDRETFDKMVADIAGGDVSGTHLVRGLDRKLLERVRMGEDVMGLQEGGQVNEDGGSPEGEAEHVDDELDNLAEQDVVTKQREMKEKKGEMAPPPPVAGTKRNRDAILAELKAQRQAAAEAAAAERAARYAPLGSKFSKIGPHGESSRLEIDSQGREVLIVTDANGNEKRKVKKKKKVRGEPKEEPKEEPHHANNESPTAEMSHPANAEEEEVEDDLDIFEGVGREIDDFAELAGADDSSEDEEDKKKEGTGSTGKGGTESSVDKKVISATEPKPASSETEMAAPSGRRNWFDDAPTAKDDTEAKAAQAAMVAALRKVRTMDPESEALQTEEEARLKKKRAAMLAAADRDMEDLDMGFGSSRFEDAEDLEMEDGKPVKLFEWDGSGEIKGGHGGKDGKKRKRGPKKHKADKNNAADVLAAMEKQKKGGAPKFLG